MDTLEQLNNFSGQQILKVRDLVINKPYKILKAKRCTTKFGVQVMLDLIDFEFDMRYDFQIYLPARYDELTYDILEDMNRQGNFYVTNTGPMGKSFNLTFTQDSSDTQLYYCM